MGKDYSKFIHYLAKDTALLYIGEDEENICDELANYFSSLYVVDMTERLLDEIDNILKKDISIVIINNKKKSHLAPSLYSSICKFDEDIKIILINRENSECDHLAYGVDAIISLPINRQKFYKKLFFAMSSYYATALFEKDRPKSKKGSANNSIEKFFDTYEGSALFLANDLSKMSKDLKNGILDHNFLVEISKKLDELCSIFAKTEQTSSVVPTYEELSLYLKRLDLSTIKPENLYGFTYLATILDDISNYLIEIFVDRTIKDMDLFRKSLLNNIKFLKDTLLGSQDESGELDFF